LLDDAAHLRTHFRNAIGSGTPRQLGGHHEMLRLDGDRADLGRGSGGFGWLLLVVAGSKQCHGGKQGYQGSTGWLEWHGRGTSSGITINAIQMCNKSSYGRLGIILTFTNVCKLFSHWLTFITHFPSRCGLPGQQHYSTPWQDAANRKPWTPARRSSTRRMRAFPARGWHIPRWRISPNGRG